MMISKSRVLAAVASAFFTYCFLHLVKTGGVRVDQTWELLSEALRQVIDQPSKLAFLLAMLGGSAASSILLQKLVPKSRYGIYRILFVPVAFCFLGLSLGMIEFIQKGDPTEILKGLIIAPAGFLFFFIPILPGWFLFVLLDHWATRSR